MIEWTRGWKNSGYALFYYVANKRLQLMNFSPGFYYTIRNGQVRSGVYNDKRNNGKRKEETY